MLLRGTGLSCQRVYHSTTSRLGKIEALESSLLRSMRSVQPYTISTMFGAPPESRTRTLLRALGSKPSMSAIPSAAHVIYHSL